MTGHSEKGVSMYILQMLRMTTHNLIESLGCAQTRWASTNDENVDRAVAGLVNKALAVKGGAIYMSGILPVADAVESFAK
jgi:hypothetical protein